MNCQFFSLILSSFNIFLIYVQSFLGHFLKFLEPFTLMKHQLSYWLLIFCGWPDLFLLFIFYTRRLIKSLFSNSDANNFDLQFRTITFIWMKHFQKHIRAFDFVVYLNIFGKQIELLDISSDWLWDHDFVSQNVNSEACSSTCARKELSQ